MTSYKLPTSFEELKRIVQGSIAHYQASPVKKADKLNEAIAKGMNFKDFNRLSAAMKQAPAEPTPANMDLTDYERNMLLFALRFLKSNMDDEIIEELIENHASVNESTIDKLHAMFDAKPVCDSCNGKRYITSERDDGREAIEACDNCTADDNAFWDKDAALLAEADGIRCESEYPHYVHTQVISRDDALRTIGYALFDSQDERTIEEVIDNHLVMDIARLGEPHMWNVEGQMISTLQLKSIVLDMLSRNASNFTLYEILKEVDSAKYYFDDDTHNIGKWLS